MADTVTIYCDGTDATPHERCYIARYDRPYRIGDEQHDKWGPVRAGDTAKSK